MVAGLFDPPPPPALRRPSITVSLDGAVVAELLGLTLELHAAPAVDACTLTLPASTQVAVGATAAVSIDGGDGDAVAVLTGAVTGARAELDGTRVLQVTDAAAVLAGTRVDRSYEQQSAGDIARHVCAAAGLDAGGIADGTRYPFVVLDAGRSVWRHLARLAAHAGHVVTVDGDGKVAMTAPAAADIAAVVTYGQDVVALSVTETTPAARGVIVGEGAAGTHGSAAWAWLVRDPAAVTADAGGGPVLAEPSLRTPEAVQAAAAARRQLPAVAVVLESAPMPAVRPGRAVTVRAVPPELLPGPAGAPAGLLPAAAGAPAGLLPDGGTTLTVIAAVVVHDHRPGRGSRTTVRGWLPATPGPALGSP